MVDYSQMHFIRMPISPMASCPTRVWVFPWPLPTSAWLYDAYQLAKHVVDAAVKQDHVVFAKKCKFARFADCKYQGSAQAFGAIKSPPALPITEVYVPHQAECMLVWDQHL